MVNLLIDQIMELSGPLPDPVKYRHYLDGLATPKLQERLEDLTASAHRQPALDQWHRPAREQMAQNPTQGTYRR